MSSVIVDSRENITLVGGGAIRRADLGWSISRAPTLVAADGGANYVNSAGFLPEAVIGDFDSISAETRAAFPAEIQHHIPEQDSTDFHKCLRSISAPLVIGLGFLGKRLDHQLAALNTLVQFPDQRCLLLDEEGVTFLCPQHIELTLPVGSWFSLFPMGPVSGASTGLEWPIDGLAFHPGGRSGTSNRVSDPRVTLDFDRPNMLVILPREVADQAITGLLG